MAEVANIAVGVIFLIAFLFLLYKFLTPGVFFQLNSNLRYEQLADRIEESYQHGFIDEIEGPERVEKAGGGLYGVLLVSISRHRAESGP